LQDHLKILNASLISVYAVKLVQVYSRKINLLNFVLVVYFVAEKICQADTNNAGFVSSSKKVDAVNNNVKQEPKRCYWWISELIHFSGALR